MIHLHNHTTHESLRDGFSKIPDLVSRVKELGMSSIAITGHGSMSSSIEFHNECTKKYTDLSQKEKDKWLDSGKTPEQWKTVKPIIGLEAYFTPEITIRDRNTYHLILLAYNQQGYKNLVKLNTESHKEYYYKPRTSIEMLEKYQEGIISLSACMGSIINTDNAEFWANEYRRIFGDRFFLEIQSSSDPKQHEYNHKVLSLADKLGIDFVCTADTHYVIKEDAPFHRLWVTQGKESDYYPTDDLYIQTTEEAMDYLSYLPYDIAKHSIDNTYKIADMCHVELPAKADLVPKYDCEDPVKELKKFCKIGWEDRVKGKIEHGRAKEYQNRYKYEMDVLINGGYVDYMLLINDILAWCRSQGIMYGFGRGSVGGSLIAWLLKFSAIDPIVGNLMFERFLNPSRITMADIDVDFQHNKREFVIKYLESKYKYVLPIRTFGEVKDRSAVQIACRLLGIPAQEAIELSKNIETIDDIEDKEKYADVITLAKKLKGLVSSFGTHASGYIVTNTDPTDYCSIEKQGDLYVINQEYHTLEHFGFLKLDLLSLSNLTIIQETLDSVDKPIDLWSLPMNDQSVYQQYANGETDCIFQVESNMMKGYAKRLKVSTFDDIVALLSIGRPAVISSGMADQYIECKDSGNYSYIHPLLEPVLSRSHSSLIFQEQVMQILQVMAKMSLADADNCRRIMGRKIPSELEQIIPGFIKGCEDNGIPKDVADKIVQWIIDSSSYLFNASHAANYSYLSYITAYLRKYFPLQYMCAVLNNEIGDLEKTKEYFAVCKKLGVEVMPPDLRYSKEKYAVVNGKIYYGLHAIKGIGKNLCTDYTDSFVDIVAHNNKRVTEALIKSGSLDYLNQPRALLLANIENLADIISRQSQCEQKIAENQALLNEATTDKDKRKYQRQLESWQHKLNDVQQKVAITETGDYDEVKGEIEVLGFSFKEVPKVKSGTLTNIFSKLDKTKKEMGWLTFKSDYGEFRCTCFAKGWSLIKDKITKGGLYVFVCNDNGILEELQVDGQVIKTNERYGGNKWKK